MYTLTHFFLRCIVTKKGIKMNAKMMERGLSVKDVRELFSYDAESGVLSWRQRPVEHFSYCENPEQQCASWNVKFAGTIVGGAGKRGYKQVSIDKKIFAVHRICYAIHHGIWPTQTIDHIDRNPSNNSIKNIRDVDQKANNENRDMGRERKEKNGSKASILLGDYIKSKGLKKQHFARMVGVRPDHLSRWLSGKVRPERPACVLIYMLTDGAVPVEAWG